MAIDVHVLLSSAINAPKASHRGKGKGVLEKKTFNILASRAAMKLTIVATPTSLPFSHFPPCGDSPRALLRDSGCGGGWVGR